MGFFILIIYVGWNVIRKQRQFFFLHAEPVFGGKSCLESCLSFCQAKINQGIAWFARGRFYDAKGVVGRRGGVSLYFLWFRFWFILRFILLYGLLRLFYLLLGFLLMWIDLNYSGSSSRLSFPGHNLLNSRFLIFLSHPYKFLLPSLLNIFGSPRHLSWCSFPNSLWIVSPLSILPHSNTKSKLRLISSSTQRSLLLHSWFLIYYRLLLLRNHF